MKEGFSVSHHFGIEHVLLDKRIYVHGNLVFSLSFCVFGYVILWSPCSPLFFYVFMYNCLNIKKGRWAISVQTPLPLLDYLFSKQVYRPRSDFLFVYIIAMFFLLKWPDPFVSSRAHTLPPTTGEAQRAPLNGWISVRVISLGLIYLITLL